MPNAFRQRQTRPTVTAEAIVERWVVTTNPKVQSEMQAFFKKYNVKSVAMSDGNMGCPHEEGQDFPHGEDCPFCPFWKGETRKQPNGVVTMERGAS